MRTPPASSDAQGGDAAAVAALPGTGDLKEDLPVLDKWWGPPPVLEVLGPGDSTPFVSSAAAAAAAAHHHRLLGGPGAGVPPGSGLSPGDLPCLLLLGSAPAAARGLAHRFPTVSGFLSSRPSSPEEAVKITNAKGSCERGRG